jgi:nucleotide-binding universal stress UspA family protein
MYDTLLIPVDLSSTNESVLRAAQHLGDPDHTQLRLLHVIETLQDEAPGEMDDFYDELRADAEQKMDAWATTVADRGFAVQCTIKYGERAPTIAKVATEDDVDLIVMRSHAVDADAPSDTAVGTVSHQVAVFAPCSVHLVRRS